MGGYRTYLETLKEAEGERQLLLKAIVAQRQYPQVRFGLPYDAPADLYQTHNAAVDALAADIRNLDLESARAPDRLQALEANAGTREVRHHAAFLRELCDYMQLVKGLPPSQ